MMATLQLLTSSQKPTFLLASRMGSLYNLMPSNQNSVQAIHLSVGDFMHIKDILKNLPENISFKKYIGYKESILTYLAPHDFYKIHKHPQPRQPRKHHGQLQIIQQQPKQEQNKRNKKNHKQIEEPKPIEQKEQNENMQQNGLQFSSMSGCGQDGAVKVFTNKGYQKITDKEYYQMVKLIKPDIWVGFTQMSLITNKGQALSKKSILKSIKKSTEFLRMIKDEKKEGILLAPVHGGKSEHLSYSINQIMKYQSIVDGLLICDVTQNTTNQQIIQILKTIRQHTGDKKLLICLASEGKLERMELFKSGVNMFEVNYPFRLAEENKALVNNTEHAPVQLENLSPLSQTCSCLACTKYSQSYIAHLLKCHEMTANVLLTIHNLHQYTQYNY